jgi:hypothetical protein
MELNVLFARWFFKNVHSTELGLLERKIGCSVKFADRCGKHARSSTVTEFLNITIRPVFFYLKHDVLETDSSLRPQVKVY